MNKQKREELVSYLPTNAFIEDKGNEYLRATWSTTNGVFTITTMKHNQSWTETRVTIAAESSDESISLVTEDWKRVVKALELLGAMP